MNKRDEQCENADRSMRKSFELGSNVTAESPPQQEKQSLQRTSTDAGIQIKESDEQQENADSSIRESREPGRNVTVESDVHQPKQHFPQTSTDEGTQIDDNSSHK
jgi:hypothetical protein